MAIIGVVAAMTVPSLMNSTEDKKLGAAAKKAYNTLQNAITMKQALTEMTPGVLTENLFAFLTSTEEGGDKVQTLKYVEISDDGKTVQTPDGIIMHVDGSVKCTGDSAAETCLVIVDVNGDGGPNFSSVKGGTGANGTELKVLGEGSNKFQPNPDENRARRDIVFYIVAGMNVTPMDEADYWTGRYITGKK